MKKFLFLFLMLFLLFIASCGGSGSDIDAEGNNDNGTGDNSGSNNDNSGENQGGGNETSSVCGNRTVESGEVCDTGAQDCSAIDPGYTSGFAVCKADCSGWDTSACQGTPTNPGNGGDNTDTGTDSDDNGTGSTGDNSDPREDADVTYIHLNGTSITVDGANPNDVTVSGSTATITASGVFEIDGTLSNSSILVDVDKTKDSEVVHVVLNGANITNSSSSPFMVKGAKDVRIFTASGTQNSLSDGSNYTIATDDPAKPDAAAALYSRADLILAGEGTLTVNGNCNDAIASKDDLDIDGGTIVVNAKDDGIRGKDSLVIRGGDISVTSGGDGIKSDSTEALELSNNADDPYENIKGYIKIKGGKITVNATNGDGIHAISYIKIENDPTIDITSGGGSVITTSSSGGGWGGGGSTSGSKYSGDTSLKGIKASIPETVTNYATLNENVTIIKIHGGKIKINSRDDGIHSGGNIEVKGGEIEIASDDDGVHADYTLLMINGSINVTMSYEGLEAQFLTVNGGITSVYGRDDGWNAAGGTDGSGMGGGPGQGGPGQGGPGGGGFGSSSGTLTLTGGIHYVKTGSGDVDGIDSNGALTISDQAVIVVECQINGGMGGSYDADGTTNLTSPWILGFTPSQKSERGENYNVSFNPNGIYGNQKIAFQPTFSGSKMQTSLSGGQPSQINDISSYNAQTMPNGVVIYYKQ